MKRSGLRADPERVRAWVDRSRRNNRIPPVSARRRAEAEQRAEVRRAALERAGHRCEAAAVVPEVRCWGPLDVDERTARGVRPGAHLELDQTQVLCRAHHDWRHARPLEAEARGLRTRGT